jgi:K+-transporting ATPase ATPase C chain
MRQNIRNGFIVLIFFTVLLGFIYPYVVNRIGYVFFRHEINGSLLYDKDGRVRGSTLIGQHFSSSKYFHTRPSKAGSDGYDTFDSSGSYFGPTSKELVRVVEENAAKYRAINNIAKNVPLPADAITFSASGLDPEISLENALLQVPRVARARDMVENKLSKLVIDYADKKILGLIGTARINVLSLNIYLDDLTEKHIAYVNGKCDH